MQLKFYFYHQTTVFKINRTNELLNENLLGFVKNHTLYSKRYAEFQNMVRFLFK